MFVFNRITQCVFQIGNVSRNSPRRECSQNGHCPASSKLRRVTSVTSSSGVLHLLDGVQETLFESLAVCLLASLPEYFAGLHVESLFPLVCRDVVLSQDLVQPLERRDGVSMYHFHGSAVSYTESGVQRLFSDLDVLHVLQVLQSSAFHLLGHTPFVLLCGWSGGTLVQSSLYTEGTDSTCVILLFAEQIHVSEGVTPGLLSAYGCPQKGGAPTLPGVSCHVL